MTKPREVARRLAGIATRLWLASPYRFTKGQAAEPKDPPAQVKG